MRECRRILNARYLILALILLTVNALFLISRTRPEKDFLLIYDIMLREAGDRVRAEGISSQEAVTLTWKAYREGAEESDLSVAREARDRLMQEAVYVDGLEESIQEKIENAELLLQRGPYREGSFEYNNLRKTLKDLEELKGLKGFLSNGIWLEKLMEHTEIQFFSLALLLMTVYRFFLDRKTGLIYMIRTARGGRGKLFRTRCLLLLAESILLPALFYLESAVLLLRLCGGREGIGLPAVSSEGFFLTAGSLSRIEYVFVMIGISAAANLAMAFLLWFVLHFFQNINIGLFAFLVLCVIDIAAHALVSPKSVFREFHYINLYYLLFPGKALPYWNWSCFSQALSLGVSTGVFALILGAVMLALNLWITLKRYETGRGNPVEKAIDQGMVLLMRALGRMPNLIKELYKLLVSQKAGLILLLLLYTVSKLQTGVGVLYDAGKSFLSAYYEEAEGLGYGQELEEIYAEYEVEYEDYVKTMDSSMETAESIAQYRRSMLGEIRENVDYVRSMGEQGIRAVVLKPFEYEGAFGKGQEENQKTLAFCNLLAAIVISCGFFSYEKRCGLCRIIAPCRNRGHWLREKIAANWILIAAFELASYGIYYRKLFQVFRLERLDAPLKSLPMFAAYPGNPSIRGMLFSDLAVKFLALAAVSALICMLSAYVKYLYCLIAGLILALPQFLFLLGFRWLEGLSLGRYIAFYPCILGERSQVIIYYAVTAVLLAAGGMMYVLIFRKRNIQG